MSYHIYKTEGFILSSVPVDEASRYISVYTKELGLVRALAQGVRNLRSKLRYSLQDLSFSKISFVRGKEIWRIVNAERTIFFKENDSKKRKFLAGVSYFLRRFVAGEESDDKLFKEIKNVFSFLDSEELSDTDIASLESLFVLRMLDKMGYGPFEEKLYPFVSFPDWERKSLFLGDDEKKLISVHIERAISHSHL